MEGFRKATIRLMIVMAFIGVMVFAMQAFIYFKTINDANQVMIGVVEKANTMLMSNNVISIDRIDGKIGSSDMEKFIDMLRSVETTYVKFDIAYTRDMGPKAKITNNPALMTAEYGLKNGGFKAVDTYSLASDGVTKNKFDTYAGCRQRGNIVYSDITMHVYIPKFIAFAFTNRMEPVDEHKQPYAFKHNMFLQINKVTASAIGIKYYKGKD